MNRVLVIGLDCMVPDVLSPPLDELMPTVAGLAREGVGGTLLSTLPPITVPAWTSMLTGRDPGELGVYGFRNRRSFGYDDLVRASSQGVRAPRVWDSLTAAGRPSIVVGVPQTSPPPAVNGALVCGFEGPVATGRPYTHPPALASEIESVIGEYVFDVPEFRSADLSDVLATVHLMTKRRFRLMRHLVTTRDWDFAMLHEIGPDRVHHCFWHFHDPLHPNYEPNSPYRTAVTDYYRVLDRQIAELLDIIPPETAVLIASDHGATAMHGGICANEILRRAGLLTLHSEPPSPTPLTSDMIDWSRTRAWADGGYYTRVFFNVAHREPHGIVPRDEVDALAERVREVFRVVDLGEHGTAHNNVRRPYELYRRVRGIPPDLMVFFDDEKWRGIGSVGFGQISIKANDTGVDEANHSRDGMFALRVPGATYQGLRRGAASILDIAPTLHELLELPADPELTGTSLLGRLGAVP